MIFRLKNHVNNASPVEKKKDFVSESIAEADTTDPLIHFGRALWKGLAGRMSMDC